MAIRSLEYLKGKFEDGDRPTGTDFSDFIESTLNSSITSLSANNVERLRVFGLGVSAIGNLYTTGDLQVDGSINALGTLTIGDENTDNVVFNADVNSNVLPDTDATYNLGASGKAWNSIYSTNLSATNNLEVGNNITVSGTVDGRDVLADGIKLDSTHTTYNTNSASYLTKGTTDTYYVNVSGDTMTGDLVLSGAGVDLILRQADSDYSAVLGTTSDGDGGLYLYGPGDTTASDIETQFRGGNYNSYISAGNLGLGTTTPNERLTVNGNISSSGDLTIGQYIQHHGDSDTLINFIDDEIRFQAGNLLLFDIHKKGSAPHEVTVNTGGNNVDFIVKDDDNNSYFIADASTTRVGINKNTPLATLHVGGDLQVSDGNLIIDRAVSNTLTVSADASQAASTHGIYSRQHDGDYSFVVSSYDNAGNLFLYGPDESNINQIDTWIRGGNYNSYISAGNLGLGTTTPGQKLSVVGRISASDVVESKTLSATEIIVGDDGFTVSYDPDTDSKIGGRELIIGNSSGLNGDAFPRPLGASGSYGGAIIKTGDASNDPRLSLHAGTLHSTTSAAADMWLDYSANDLYFDLRDVGAGFLPDVGRILFRSNTIDGTGTTLMTMKKDGTIGIGTEKPTEKLSVVGTVSAQGFKTDGSTGWTGTFTNGDGDTVTVKNGIITGVA